MPATGSGGVVQRFIDESGNENGLHPVGVQREDRVVNGALFVHTLFRDYYLGPATPEAVQHFHLQPLTDQNFDTSVFFDHTFLYQDPGYSSSGQDIK